jgi:hypothetical protein
MDSDATPPVHKVVPPPGQREVGPDEVGVEIDGWILPQVSPELRARFDHFDAMTKGMTPDEILAILPDLHHDAEGVMRLRRQQIRAVPDLD